MDPVVRQLASVIDLNNVDWTPETGSVKTGQPAHVDWGEIAWPSEDLFSKASNRLSETRLG